MIYDLPLPGDPVDQGDIIDSCPILRIAHFSLDELASDALDSLEIEGAFSRVVVLTQTCDLANQKTPVLRHLLDTRPILGSREKE
jgi:hypothetical protein